MRLVLAVAVALLSIRVAAAAPRKVLVLKLDGDVDAAERTRLQSELARLAAANDTVVSSGDTTLAETASAVGCDPAEAACVETVRKTLGVDELVYGQVTVGPDHREELAVHHLPPKDQHTSLAPGEPVVFDGAHRAPPPPLLPPLEGHRRNYAIALFAGGGVAVLIGLTLWTQAGSRQDDIDSHPTTTLASVQDLIRIEDQATTYARAGNVMMLVGIGLGAYGGYLLYEDRKARQVIVAPAPMGVSVSGVW